MKLSKLLSEIMDIPSHIDVNVAGLTLDSRHIKPGELFVAVKGTTMDGHGFIDEALKKGAVAVLLENETLKKNENLSSILYVKDLRTHLPEIAARFFNYPTKNLEIVGITGTNGKTSCSHFVARTLHYLKQTCGVIGTLGCGLLEEMKESALTTPDAITLQRELAALYAKGAKYVAMEVSSHSLDQNRVQGIPFKVGVLTNLTRDHLDYHGTMDHYATAKQKLFTHELLQHAVINADDAYGQAWLKAIPSSKKIWTYGINHPADITVEKMTQYPDGIKAIVRTPWGTGELQTLLMGRFNLSNLLAVLTTLCLLDMPFEETLHHLAKLTPIAGRMQIFGGGNKPWVIVDYSHTPDSLQKALSAIKERCQGKVCCVFGCGGDRDRGKRPDMAKVAEKFADSIIVTDDNPRTENPTQIVADIMQGFLHPKNIIIEHDRAKAIGKAIQKANRGDYVLIAGKGAERYQLIGDKKLPFNDIEKVKQFLSLSI